jgi:hypothetical protein
MEVRGAEPSNGKRDDARENNNEDNNNNDQVDEARRLRRLQVMMSMVMSVIGQDPDLTLEEAAEISANARRAALSMFPDKELAYDILYRPRLQRLMNERFRLQ